jgi:hypothetical protein
LNGISDDLRADGFCERDELFQLWRQGRVAILKVDRNDERAGRLFL